jgi:hypothetical protein
MATDGFGNGPTANPYYNFLIAALALRDLNPHRCAFDSADARHAFAGELTDAILNPPEPDDEAA